MVAAICTYTLYALVTPRRVPIRSLRLRLEMEGLKSVAASVAETLNPSAGLRSVTRETERVEGRDDGGSRRELRNEARDALEELFASDEALARETCEAFLGGGSDVRRDEPTPMVAQTPPPTKKPFVAICAPSHSGTKRKWTSGGPSEANRDRRREALLQTSLQTKLIPSIERTVTPAERRDWEIRLYLGFDDDDAWWRVHHGDLKAPDWLRVEVGWHSTPKSVVPFRPMTKQAFDDGAEYIVRLNDDTEMVTAGWLTLGVDALRAMVPRNVGVVGPTQTLGKKERIMVHDMVHKTHLHIFKTYYPTAFDNWWVDDWITHVYEPNNSKQLLNWVARHLTNMHGTRYKVAWSNEKSLKPEVAKGRATIAKWINDHPTGLADDAPAPAVAAATSGLVRDMQPSHERAIRPLRVARRDRDPLDGHNYEHVLRRPGHPGRPGRAPHRRRQVMPGRPERPQAGAAQDESVDQP